MIHLTHAEWVGGVILLANLAIAAAVHLAGRYAGRKRGARRG